MAELLLINWGKSKVGIKFLILFLIITGSLNAQVLYNFGQGTGRLTAGAGNFGNNPAMFNNFPTSPVAIKFVYGISSGSNATIQASNPGLLRLGDSTEAQACAGQNDTSFCKFGITGYVASVSLIGYMKFDIVFAGDSLANSTSSSGVWYYFNGDGGASDQFMYANSLRKNLTQSGVSLRWTFTTNGGLTFAYYDNTISNWVNISTFAWEQKKRYNLEIYSNTDPNTSTTYSREGNTISLNAGKMDLWVNSTKIGNAVNVSQIRNAQNMKKVDSYMWYGEGSNNAWIFVDNPNSSGVFPTTYAYYTIRPPSNNTNLDISVLSNWTSKSDGTSGGTVPTSFTQNYTTWFIRNYNGTTGNTFTLSTGNLPVTGTDSYISLGDSGQTASFTIPSGKSVSSFIDVESNGDLIIQSTTIPMLRETNPNSVVEYSNGSLDILFPLYYNLKILSGTKTLSSNFIVDNKVTVGDGTNSATLVIPTTKTLTGTVDVNNNGMLKIQNTTLPGFGTFANGSTVEFDTASSSQTMPATPVSYYNLIIDNANGVNLGAATTVGNTLTLEKGTLNTGSQTLTFINGNTPISRTGGTITTSTGTNFIFGTAGNTGGNAFTIPSGTFSGTPSINNFTLNRTNNLTLGSALTIGGTMTLTSGALVLGGNTLTLNGTVSGSGTISGDNNSVVVTGGSGALGTLNFTTGAQSLKSLTINRTGGSVTLGTDLTMDGATDGTLTLTNGVFDISGKTLTFITGNTPVVRANGSITTSSSTNLIFGTPGNTGGNAFTIPAGAFTSAPVINNFTLNRTNSLTLSQDLSVNNSLSLTSGLLVGKNGANDYITTLGSSTSSIGTLTVGTGRIVGKFKRYISTSTSNYLFPIGTVSNYNGININYTSGPSAGGTLTAGFITGDPGNLNGVTPIVDSSTNPLYSMGSYSNFGYWSVINSGVSGTYSISLYAYGFTGISADSVKRQNVRIIKRADNTSLWNATGNHSQSTGGQTTVVANRSNLTSFSEFGLASNWADNSFQGILPVYLTAFSSILNGRNVRLNWTTSGEINNAGFLLERKKGDGEWSPVVFINGAGNKNSPTDYTYSDNNLNTGKYSYRLKQTDINGNFEYYNLSNDINIAAPSKYDISQNYPNPFNPLTTIEFSLPEDSRVNITIFDLTGREIRTLANDSRTAGFYSISFDGSSLSSGIYFYRITAQGIKNNFTGVKKMILLK